VLAIGGATAAFLVNRRAHPTPKVAATVQNVPLPAIPPKPDSPRPASIPSRGACDEQSPADCTESALARKGELGYALPRLESACRAGHARGCNALGNVLWHAEGKWRDVNRARREFERACTAKYPPACINLGLHLATHAPHDRARASALLESGCVQNAREACYVLGRIRRESGDAAGAKRSLRRACELGHQAACRPR
jgi:TPR repeat protein